jgi:tRNA(fMet)-specific endonuclease VapC
MRYMLDTNCCIHLIRKKPLAFLEKLRALPVPDVGISSITLAELAHGIAQSSRPAQNRDALLAFLVPMKIAEFGNEAASCYGMLRAMLEKQGKPIGSMDLLIAAHALSLSAVLVTGNTREFEQVPGLVVENWIAV